MIASILLLAAMTVSGVPEWENPQVNSFNRMPPRTYSMPLAGEGDALSGELEPATPYRKSLNGDWRINWVGEPSLRPVGFERTDFDDSRWDSIDVPSCVEMRGFGVPHYVNVRYPHANMQPFIRDRMATNLVFNPVSSYRTRFSVPKQWSGRNVFLRFDGVYSAYYVWVNGKFVGYSEDSTSAAEFDITSFLSERTGADNVLAVQVYKWCDGSYLEDQDMFRFSGIFRDVSIWAMPEDGIWDFKVSAKCKVYDGKCEAAEIAISGVNGEWNATLYDADRRYVANLDSRHSAYSFKSTMPHLWSAEKPYLYTLMLKKGTDIRMKRVGFKDVRVVGNTVLFNGRKIKFKGVNRHETHPRNGKTVSLADMKCDVELMKNHNFNAVRTAHYPNHHLWYDLCDRYGLYVVAEANVEAHEPGYKENGLGSKPMWKNSIVERNVSHAICFRNHPSVTFWSPGNETGHGEAFLAAVSEIRKLDGTRPFVWERGNVDVEIDAAMYYPVDWVHKRGRLGDAADGSMDDRYKTPSGRQSAGKPFLHLEYAHSMGNALGNFREYWDAYYSYDCLIGGFVWDWIDQTLLKKTDRIGKDGKCIEILSYGGDYDEQPNDGSFCANGLIGSDRKETPKLIEAGHVLRNLVVDDNFVLENRFGFTYADEFACEWILVEDGVEIECGAMPVPHLAPLSRVKLECPQVKLKDGHEYFINIVFKDLEGRVVSRNQIALQTSGKPDSPAFDNGDAGSVIAEKCGCVHVETGGTHAVFDKRTGALSRLEMNGCVVLADCGGAVHGPRITCARAFTDNDYWLRGCDPYIGWGTELVELGFYPSGLSQLRYHAPSVEVLPDGRIKTCVTVNGSKSAGFKHKAVWSFRSDGGICVENWTEPFGNMPDQLPRFGLSLCLGGALTNMTWYGRGPHENYVDRCSGSFVGRYSSTVQEQFVAYARPQDCGSKSDVRWVSFSDDKGRGVRFSHLGGTMFVQALHYGWEDLEFARHRVTQLRFGDGLIPRKEVLLNLDIRQCGLGNGSCGRNPTLDKYRFKVQPEYWILLLEPVEN